MHTPMKKGYFPCPRCGGPMRKCNTHGFCGHCQKIDRMKSPRQGGQGHKYTGRIATCRMPKCHKRFRLRKDQDPRWTWYCHKCRTAIREITDGVGWLRGCGIEIVPDQEERRDDHSDETRDREGVG